MSAPPRAPAAGAAPRHGPREGGATGGRDRRATVLLLAGLVLVALNLRAALTSVGPVIEDLRADLGLSGTAIGMLTTAPLLALGLVSPLAPRLADRFGAERVVLAALVAIGGGVLLRGLAPVALLFGGTLIAGCGIAVGNVLLPGVVKRRFPERASMMTGLYSVGLSLGAALAAGLTVPVEEWLGGDWRPALAVWALPAALAAAVWLPQLGVRRDGRGAPVDGGERTAGVDARGARGRGGARPVRLWGDRRAWAVTVFMGTQSTLFYTLAAWLPEIARAGGTSRGAAGALLALVTVISIPLGPLAATVAGRIRDQRPLALVAALCPPIGWLGLLLFPGTPLPFAVLVGLGTGIGFPLALTLFVLRTRDARHTAALSGMAQAVGYTLAALGPLGVGALHDLSGGWPVPLVVLAGVGVPQFLAGLVAGRPGYVGEPAAAVAAAEPGATGSDPAAA